MEENLKSTTSPFLSGVPYGVREYNLTCKVECDPLCNISWYRDGKIVSTVDGHAQHDSAWPPNANVNKLLRVESTLAMDLSFAAGLDREDFRRRVEANYTCLASGNGFGPSARSTTDFRVFYPPANITVGQG